MRNKIKDHDCKQELRSILLKATPARLGVLQFLESSEKPLDIASIIDYLKKRNIATDQATVFRIINTFTEKGLTKQINFNEGKFRYELSSKNDHHHLICEKCENIEDIEDCAIADLEKTIKRKKMFHVKNHSLEFFGLCAKCQ